MKFNNLKRFFIILAVLALLPLQWSCSQKTSTTPTNYTAPITPGTMAVNAMNYVPSTIPTGNLVVGSILEETMDYPGIGLISTNAAMVLLLTNGAAVTNAGVTLGTPGGPVLIPYTGSVTANGYGLAGYTSTGFTYTPGGSYSLAVSFSGGTVTSNPLTAPGGITYSADGSSVTCSNLGNYQVAVVDRMVPNPALTFNATTPGSLGSPFNFPSSAYSSTSLPATFYSAYAAGATVYSFSGTSPATGSAFVGMQFYDKEVTR